jgi:hypothetical protein
MKVRILQVCLFLVTLLCASACFAQSPMGGVTVAYAVSRTSGSWTLDKGTSTSDASCTSCAGAPLTGLTGTDDFLITWAVGNSNSSAPTISGGSWAVADSHLGDFTTSSVATIFAYWNGSTSANPTNSTITYSVTDIQPVAALAFK